MTLIERLEAGERWDGDNAEVLRALGWAILPLGMGKDPEGWTHGEPPRPIDSVDDALRLVPEGWRTADVDQDIETGMWLWSLEMSGLFSTLFAQGRAATAAIALTIAILRAHEASHD